MKLLIQNGAGMCARPGCGQAIGRTRVVDHSADEADIQGPELNGS